jgi:NADH-quinone oxidoreductase subunit C
MTRAAQLAQNLQAKYGDLFIDCSVSCQQVTVELEPEQLLEFCRQCRQESTLQFDMLIDICGVDYLDYGVSEWAAEETTSTGFSRGVQRDPQAPDAEAENRFAVVYHLLSTVHNQRLRLRVVLPAVEPRVSSVVDIWPAANWFEREAFDLFGILFEGHPDLRRILTDYGFSGYPLRKDFPLSGHVEVRYDAAQQRVVYDPVDIEPRIGVAKVIRDDNRYLAQESSCKK